MAAASDDFNHLQCFAISPLAGQTFTPAPAAVPLFICCYQPKHRRPLSQTVTLQDQLGTASYIVRTPTLRGAPTVKLLTTTTP